MRNMLLLAAVVMLFSGCRHYYPGGHTKEEWGQMSRSQRQSAIQQAETNARAQENWVKQHVAGNGTPR